jgi:hypothetical protein
VPEAQRQWSRNAHLDTNSAQTRHTSVATIDDMTLLDLPRVRTVAAAGALLLALVFAARILLPAGAPRSNGAPAPSPPRAAPQSVVVVHVVGGVRRPGLYRLPLGSRIDDAVRRAGGPTRRAETQLVNLAAPIADGQQVVVPVREPAAGRGVGDGSSLPSGPVHLNTATLADLDALPGVGPVTTELSLSPTTSQATYARPGHGALR